MAAKRGRKFLRGSIWWIQYWFNGKDRRESTHSTNEAMADKFLTKRLAAKDDGKLTESAIKPRRFEDLQAAIERDYRLQENASLGRMLDAFKSLASKFAHWNTASITDTGLEEYVDERLALGKAKATISYELRVFKRAFKLARVPAPLFPVLELKNIRTEELSQRQAEAVLRELPAHLRPVMTAAFFTGWRTQSELLPLEWKSVNFETGVMTIPIGRSKNGEGRTFPFAELPGLKAVLDAQWEAKVQLERTRGCTIPWVFFRVSQRAVTRIKSYKNAWRAATQRAGVGRKWVHDFRRCAARALRDSAVPESVAMSLLGHKTPSMFRRYQITNDGDKRAGVEKLAAYHAQRPGLQDTLRDNSPDPASDDWRTECVTS